MYHLSALPIDKYTLLKQVAETYRKETVINEFTDFEIDRSLNSQKLTRKLGLVLAPWPELIEYMHKDYVNRYQA